MAGSSVLTVNSATLTPVGGPHLRDALLDHTRPLMSWVRLLREWLLGAICEGGC
jgi:hypothetical protein